MNILNKLSLTLALLTLGSISSCNKERDYELQTIRDINLQVSGFGLSSNSDNTLSSYSFSIENRAGEGLITNDNPLPFQKAIDTVTIPLQGVNREATEISIAIGNGEYQAWTPTTQFIIPSDTRTLSLRLRTLEVPGTERYSYTYRVQIRQYTQDAETISWVADNAYTNNLFPLSGQVANDVAIIRTAQYAGASYALGNNGNIYQFIDSQWTALPNLSGVVDLLGILPQGTDRSSLVLRMADNAVALYSNGILNQTTTKLPDDFPSVNSAINSVSTYSPLYVGGSMNLVVVTPEGKTQTWLYSEGSTKIAKLSEHRLNLNATLIGTAVVFLNDRYYILANTSEGIKVYYSADANTWIASGANATLGLENLGNTSSATLRATTLEGKLYLILSEGSTNRVFAGEPLNSATNF